MSNAETTKNKRRALLKASACSLGFLSLLLLWYFLAWTLQSQGNRAVPYPHEAFSAAFLLLFGSEAFRTWSAVGWTLLRLVLGFAVSFFFGCVLGTLAGLYPFLELFFRPWVILKRSLPTAAAALLLIAVFFSPSHRSQMEWVPLLLVYLVAFPLIYEAFLKAIQSEEKEILDSLDLECGYKSIRSVVSVLWPDAVPFILLAGIQSFGLSSKVAIMGEVLCSTSASHLSLGGLISNAQSMGEIEKIIPYSLISVLFLLLIDIAMILLKKFDLRPN